MNTFHAKTAKDAYQKLSILADAYDSMMNVSLTVLDVSGENKTVTTPLFPKEALEFYSAYNLGKNLDQKDMDKWYTSERGGPQGDYRKGMPNKIERVVLALKDRPRSKRAVLTVPYTDKCSVCVETGDDEQWKCLRELYFSVFEGKLNCTGVMRSQALSIFPKNIHFIASVMEEVAKGLHIKTGNYTHVMHYLVKDRS